MAALAEVDAGGSGVQDGAVPPKGAAQQRAGVTGGEGGVPDAADGLAGGQRPPAMAGTMETSSPSFSPVSLPLRNRTSSWFT